MPVFFSSPEPEFVNLFRGPGINSQPCGPAQQLYMTYRPGIDSLESIPGSLNVCKYGLCIYSFAFRFSDIFLQARKIQSVLFESSLMGLTKTSMPFCREILKDKYKWNELRILSISIKLKTISNLKTNSEIHRVLIQSTRGR